MGGPGAALSYMTNMRHRPILGPQLWKEGGAFHTTHTLHYTQDSIAATSDWWLCGFCCVYASAPIHSAA